jgi:DNA polymerase I-like protein with 3'-5' exonuclease and polymerase domains/intein/homing endonuclease
MSIVETNVLRLPKPNYQYITKEEDARRAFNDICRFPLIEVDSEANGLDPFTTKMMLLQIGTPEKVYVFDLRKDINKSEIDIKYFKPLLTNKRILKLFQNVVYDMKLIKLHGGFYVENIYDTMLVEQLFNLGISQRGADLISLVLKYLGITMDKEPRDTFANYVQDFQPYQLEYAANDVVVLRLVREMQMERIIKESFQNVCRLEFEFTRPMCEMELNGICFDIEKHRLILQGIDKERTEKGDALRRMLDSNEDQTTLFGTSSVNIDSNIQLKKSLNRFGLTLESTDVKELGRYKGFPIVDALLDYRKAQKFISTYGESLINKVHPITGRLHTEFRQMVSTGRMSSSRPNLQNIPKKQIYRSCFIAKPGYVLITSDMSGAELRILGNLSEDQIFIESYRNGIDLHTRTSSEIFDVPMDKVSGEMRNAAKAINFGLAYGLSKFGLAQRLKLTEQAAEDMINKYFQRYKGVKKYLEKSARQAVVERFSRTVSGRKRYYTLPDYEHPDYKKAKASVEREAKNAPIQGCLDFNTIISGHGEIGKLESKEIVVATGLGREVNAVGLASGEKELYHVILSNGSYLDITLDHIIPIVNENGIVDKKVKDIEFNKDCLLIPLKPINGIPSNIGGYKYVKGHWRETFVDYPYPNQMTSELAFVIGCLIGDGNYSKHNNFSFVCSEDQIELFNKFNECVKNLFNYTPVITSIKKKNKVLFKSQISSVVLRGFLFHVGLEYKINKYKCVPNYFFKETIKNKCALLNGLFSTDGGFTKESGPNFTTSSEQLSCDIHNLLFSVGINSHRKSYKKVFRIQIGKRFNEKFKSMIGFSVDIKNKKLSDESSIVKYGDRSIVPSFIPKQIEKCLRESNVFKTLSYTDKAHLRQFKLGHCSFSSWRKFYAMLPFGEIKNKLALFLDYDFCYVEKINLLGIKPTFDISCGDVHYFIANGVVVHNSNADTIKEAMIYIVDRLDKSGLDAKLLLTVHDEVIIETREDHAVEAKRLVEQSIKDGFGKYFHLIPMETDALLGPCWLKSKCEAPVDGKKCNGTEMEFAPDEKYKTKIICKKCGSVL